MSKIENESTFKEEVKKLDTTIEVMEYGIEYAKQNVEKLKNDMRKFKPSIDNMAIFYAMEESERVFLKNINDYERNKDKPYFSSIGVIFKDGKDCNKKLYIGKCGVKCKEGTELEVIDWRAPVASLYYDGRIGDVSYEAPEGIIECTLTNKRMYTINEGMLEDYIDIDVTASDDLLKPYLSASSDNRLKNIISTIQAEQNKIIRASMKKTLIVQGVAGSGKTTAALHRIAYLVYENDKELKPSDFMIIAPNKLFLDYISEVLPDLGVDNVKQLTFEEFARDYLELKYNLTSSNTVLLETLENVNSVKDSKNVKLKAASIKGSLAYKEAVDRFLDKIQELYLPKGDLQIADVIILDNSNLKSIFNEIISSSTLSLDEIYEKFLQKLSSYIERNYGKIEDSIVSRRSQRIEELKKEDLSLDKFNIERISVFNEYEYNELLKNRGKKLIAQYSKRRKKKNALEYYNLFIDELENYLIDCDSDVILYIKKHNKESKNMLDFEDLPAIMYIKKSLDGKNQKYMAKHIVIDEAQDYSPFQLYMLKETLENESMTILGDIAQGIYSYRGINDWDYVNNSVFDGNANIEVLDKSYRTTVEIMDLGNDVISNIENKSRFTKAVPVIRNGAPVQISKLNSSNQLVASIVELLENLTKERKNIAIITKNFDEAKKIHKMLSAKTEFDVQIVSEKVNNYQGGIVVIPSYLSKGLEFDSVIITNANDELYLKNEMDAKLLYVAITRAMHTLNIFYTGNLSELLLPKK